MINASQVNPGVVLSLGGELFQVESAQKVSQAQEGERIQMRLKEVGSRQRIEKCFEVKEKVSVVALKERELEFLYRDGEGFFFLDIRNLDEIEVPLGGVEGSHEYLRREKS